MGAGGTTASGGSNGAIKSAGCGKIRTLQNGRISIQSGGVNRSYILQAPTTYDNTHAYRLILAYHWFTGSAQQVADCTTEGIRCFTTQSPFYGLWNLSSNSTIFVAPDGLNAGWANPGGQDVTFTDDLLKQVEADLCIDTSRVFANGFSFGAAMTYVLACVRPTVFRAVAVYSGSPTLTPGCANGIATPVAYYGSHGTNDGTLAFSGGEAVRDSFVRANGCTPISPDPMPPSHGHACVSYVGCSSGHPVRWCPFEGGNPLGAGTSGTGHTPSPLDQGSPMTWNPAEVWAFFSQF